MVNSIAEIEGNTAIAVISDLMSNERGGKGILLGGVAGITPPEIVILGASITGSVAARAAIGLGAMVKVFDHDINKLRKIQHYLGRQVFTSVIHPKVIFKALASAVQLSGTCVLSTVLTDLWFRKIGKNNECSYCGFKRGSRWMFRDFSEQPILFMKTWYYSLLRTEYFGSCGELRPLR